VGRLATNLNRLPSRLSLAVVGAAVLMAGCGVSGHTVASQPSPTATAALPSPSVSPTPGQQTVSPSTTTTSTLSGVSLENVNWPAVTYPLDCVPSPGVRVLQVAYATPHPGTTVALVVLNCNYGTGAPPDALLMYDGASSTTAPHLAQTLLSLNDDWAATGPSLSHSLAVDGANVSFPVAGYSSNAVGRCCPDIKTTLSWTWAGTQYHETSNEPPHGVTPS
jgi:hypothetical protein